MLDLKLDAQGLLPAIAQDRLTGQVRMLGWMSPESLNRTRETGFATFYSRSRQKLWTKGESSGNRLRVHSITADCDRDTLLLLVDPEGPSCHTGRETCFFERLAEGEPEEVPPVAPQLWQLEGTIAARQQSSGEQSYTKSLLDAGPDKIGAKIREEADELARAIASETNERVASEAADLLYHALVGLRARGVSLRQVIEVLAGREGVGGHAEKAARTRG